LVFLGDKTFSFSGKEQYITTLEMWCKSLAPKIGNTPFSCPPPESKLCFYASLCDMQMFFRQLETQASMRYWCDKETARFEHFHQLFSERFQDDKNQKTFHIIDICTHNTVDVTLGGLRIDIENVVVPGMITYIGGCPRYGGTLLRKLNKLFELLFDRTSVKHYEIYYLGPDIWNAKEHLIFDNGDPRFRWSDGRFTNVWRSEWEVMK